MAYITRGLTTALLEFAEEAEPESFSAGLGTTPAREFESPLRCPPATPIFTHFYHPDAGRSVNAVFGMDFSTPAGRTEGRFVSHPQGELRVELTDDLHATMFVAVPPWELDQLAVFGRRGDRQPLEIIAAEPPVETL
ncbi:hypothetical protein [Halalkalicoccus jeotgali]|uniref:Uncharacterized protein n=1 Tax=Halalkalicoccus jeotgali (strain DSM 18796 / CECT 7217 / JCM 14584 / KCTC 4019 / B3) TaxID=795797 RepID=D8J4N3_HALJB|nr:hypothetical protein [Halalkalicoccus jeotgali]ADJ15500.1 hypothetical protein HacjB3_10585 [Halalkalicoccus jeotgali B3]ELY36091.1 hypothetical protein C497_12082 [Halalkalicoccus jeotgali B3]